MKFDISLPNMPEDGLITREQGREIVEYLYGLQKYLRYMFAHIDEENLTDALNERIDTAGTDEGMLRRVEDAEGNISQVKQTAKAIAARVENTEGDITEILLTTDGIAAAVKNNRLRFSEKGLEIINAVGEVVFSQNNATGDLSITGILRALGGVIGGFTIEDGALSAGGTRIVLDALNGRVRLGQLTITDSTTFGPVLQSAAGLSFVVGGQLYWILANGGITAQMPVYAQHGLFATPGDVVSYAPNMWMNPMTGKIHRTTGTAESGGGGQTPDPDPDPGQTDPLMLEIGVSATSMPMWTKFTIYANVHGGVPPYQRFLFEVSYNGGPWQTLQDGSADISTSTLLWTGTAIYMITVWDSAGNSYAQVSPVITVY